MKAGSIDQPAPGTTTPNDEVVVRGWALFEDGAPARVEAWLDGVPLGSARLGLRRDDVAAAHDDTDAPICGFELRAGLDPATARQATITVAATSGEGERYEFAPILVTVAEPPPVPATRAARVTRSGRGPGVRVLAFTNVLALSGASAYFSQLLRELQRQERIEATVVTAVDGPLRAELEADGIPVHLLGPIALDDPEAYADRIDELAAWAAGEDHQVVFVNTVTGLTLPGADLAERLGLPTIWSIHESFHPALLWDGLAPESRARGEAALERATFALFAAEATRDLYLGLRDLSDRSLTIPYGLDLHPIDEEQDGFDRARVRRELGISAQADLIICVGTVEPRKGQVSLLRAFESIATRHPSAYIAFIGGDQSPNSAALAERITASPRRARALVIPKTERVQRWYGVADLLVCASDIESLPLTVLEAMAWELPVLATRVFGLPELIEDGASGWLCEPNDIAALAAGLDTALSADADTRRRIGAAGRQTLLGRRRLDSYARVVAEIFDLAAAGEDVSRAASEPRPSATFGT